METQTLNEERGRQIRKKREDLGIDIRVLAEGVARVIPVTNMVNWLKDIEEGKQLPSWRMACELSKKLDISLPEMKEWLEANGAFAGPETDVSRFSKPEVARDWLDLFTGGVTEDASFAEFGEYIVFQGMRSGVSFAELLDWLCTRENLNVSENYLKRIVSGQRRIAFHLACKIADRLGISPADIGERLSIYVSPIEEITDWARVEEIEEIPRAREISLADRFLKHLSGPAGPYIKELMDLIETRSIDQRAKILAVVEKMLTALNKTKEDEKK